MRWITLFALAAVSAVASFGADTESTDPADAPAPATTTAAPANAPEPVPVLTGVVIERAGGGFMTVTMDGPRMVLRFFDAKKKAIAPDVHHAIVKFKMTGRRPQNRTLLLGADGLSLTHGRTLRPPFTFKAFVSLVQDADGVEVDDDDESAEVATGERYTVDYP